MDASDGDPINPSQEPSQPRTLLRRVESATFNRPNLNFLNDTMEVRDDYLNLCVPLYKYALGGKWEKAEDILLGNREMLNAAIAQGWPTVLHVAAGEGHFDFVKELVKMMEENRISLDLQDSKGNTALSFAAISGNLEMVKFLYDKNHNLPKIRSGSGFTPLIFAALQGRADMATYLFGVTVDENFEEAEWNKLFLTCIDSGIYELALEMLNRRPQLAFATDEYNNTGLHIMARKTEHQNQIGSSGTKLSSALELVHVQWDVIIRRVESKAQMKEIINRPSKLLFDAAKFGNFEFLAVLMKAYPDLIWEYDNRGLSIIHIAVLYRYHDIFNLIHAYSGSKDIILSYEDTQDKNSVLHLAAKLAPSDRLELVSGAAFRMKFELMWFEEVRKVMLPLYVNIKNRDGHTPRELFTKEHATLREEAEKWMNRTAESCMLVSTLIATGVFSAAFSIPGGINDNSGTPNYLRKRSFKVFAIADAIAMITSSASIVAFLSILISRYAEYDFYKSLPLKLIFGLITLFVAITSMMIAFSSAFFVTFDRGIKWVPGLVSVLSFLPIAVFLFWKFKLFYEIIYSTYHLNSLFKPTKHKLY